MIYITPRKNRVFFVLLPIVILLVILGLLFFYYTTKKSNTSLLSDPEIQIGKIGSENVYRKDINEIMSRLSVKNEELAWNNLVEESLKLQYGSLIGKIILTDNTFNNPNKDYAERNKLLEQVNDFTKIASEKVSYAVHTMYYNADTKSQTLEILKNYSSVYIRNDLENKSKKIAELTTEYQQLNEIGKKYPITTTYQDMSLTNPNSPNVWSSYLFNHTPDNPESEIIYSKNYSTDNSQLETASIVNVLSKYSDNNSVNAYYSQYKSSAEVTKYEL